MVRGEWFGVPVLSAREVLREFTIERAPGAPTFVLGLINLRGEILTVVDCAARLGLPELPRNSQSAGVSAASASDGGTDGGMGGGMDGSMDDDGDEDRRIVVVEHGADVVGLLVDRVTEVLTLRNEDIEASPEVGHAPRARYIAGIAVRPAGLAFLLSVASLCSDEAACPSALDADGAVAAGANAPA